MFSNNNVFRCTNFIKKKKKHNIMMTREISRLILEGHFSRALYAVNHRGNTTLCDRVCLHGCTRGMWRFNYYLLTYYSPFVYGL